ncbi:3-oxoadipate enol-lactonase [Bradyrhizobium sp. SSBR45G]|uniref:alpha/beta fold hydrolase n=1 Tax=unclassified Bradyrhizobium TaxID=2631580 RepID=UPI002342AFB6|nr:MULTISPECIES: alpha/beta hydrolase [unclassified Bradyrhizobium]GLH81995.1 3-oxoadipate enol-lactonase [Bradyrhizobium sp. SSBR45G]GLH85367.1 3-oxoadipate enol-lactonase [Bradyrhizobium sp. SSBR45R]
MNWIHLDDLTLRYEARGNGTQTLVLLHELGGSLDSFDALMPALGDDRRVLRYDLRGAGLSEKPRSSFSFTDHVGDLHRLLAGLGIAGPVDIAGVAAGAAVAVSFALTYPDRVSSLSLCAPALSVDADRVQYLARRSELCMRSGMRAVAAETLDRSYPPALRRDRNAYLAYLGRFLGNDPVGYACNNLAFAKVDLLPRLRDIPHRCLLLAGAHDLLRPEAQVMALAGMIPHAEPATINDAGHLMHVQAPAEMAGRLVAFLAQPAAPPLLPCVS